MLIHVGDTLPALTGQIRLNGQPLDLTPGTTSVQVRLVGPADVVIQEPAAKAAGTQGNVSYTWAAGDTDEPGVYSGSWIVTTAGGTFTQPGIDVVVYDPDELWAGTAAVEAIIGAQTDIEPVVAALVQAQQAILAWVTREIPTDPVPDRVRRAHAIMAARVVTAPQFGPGSSSGVIQESIGDHSVRYARPQESAAVLDPSMHPEVVKLLKPWAPTNYTSATSAEAGGIASTRQVDDRLPAGSVDYTSTSTVADALDSLFAQTGGGGGEGVVRVELLVTSPIEDFGGSITNDVLDLTSIGSVTPAGTIVLLGGQTNSANDGEWISNGDATFDRGDDINTWLAARPGRIVEVLYAMAFGESLTMQVVFDGTSSTLELVGDATELTTSVAALTSRLNRYYPTTPVVPHLHRSKYVTFDPDFPLDGSATHVGGQSIDAGQNITVALNNNGKGGIWTLSLTGPATRTTGGLGAMLGSDIGNYDLVSYTGTSWAYETTWRLYGSPTALGIDTVFGAEPHTRVFRPTLIATSLSSGTFTVLNADGTTTSKAVSALSGTLDVLVTSPTFELVTVANGAVAQVEDFSQAYTSVWVSRGISGAHAGTSVSYSGGVVGFLTNSSAVASHAASHQDGGSDELSLDGSQITSGTVAFNRLPTGTTSTTVAVGNDSRFTDSRTPTAHKTSHATGGSDALSPSDIGAVPTSRTVAGKALTADVTLTASDVGAAATAHVHSGADITSGTVAAARLGSGTPSASNFLRGDGTWSTPTGSGDVVGPASSVDGRVALFDGTTGKLIRQSSAALATVATSGSASDLTTGTVATARLALPVRRLAGSGISYTSSTELFGTPPTDIQGNVTTAALAAGTMRLTPCDIAGGPTLATISFEVSASALNAGQSVSIGCYARASTGLPTGTPVWTLTQAVGTTIGTYNVSTTNTLPEGGCWLALLNPSTNAGSVTVYIYQPVGPYTFAIRTLTNRPALLSTTGISALPDVSAYTVSNVAGANVWAASQQGVLFMLR